MPPVTDETEDMEESDEEGGKSPKPSSADDKTDDGAEDENLNVPKDADPRTA